MLDTYFNIYSNTTDFLFWQFCERTYGGLGQRDRTVCYGWQ